LGRTNVVRSGDIVGIAFSAGKKKDAKKGKTVHYMLKKALNSDNELTGNADDMFNKLYNNDHWVEVAGINDSTPINVWHSSNGDSLRKQTFESYLSLGAAAADVNNTVAPQQQGNRARRGSVRNNPSDRGFKNAQEALEEAVAAAQLENTVYVVAFIPNKPYGRVGTFAISPLDQHEFYFRHLYPQYRSGGSNDVYTISPSGQVYEEWKITDPGKPAKNPVTVGQGQHFFIQLRNPRDFTFTAKEKKNAKRSKGTMSIAGTPGKDRTGLNEILGGFEDAGYVAWSGTHKKTGKRMPWIIQLPRKKGKTGSVKFKKARVTDKETGQSYSTIRPFTADKKIKAAWEKFVATYGEPIYDNNPKKRSLFKIRRKNRGSYYKRK
jgi:hypothetical protein